AFSCRRCNDRAGCSLRTAIDWSSPKSPGSLSCACPKSLAVNRVRHVRYLQNTLWFDESAAPIHLGRDLDSNICSAAIDRSACAHCNGVDLLDPVYSDPVAGSFFCLSGGGPLSFFSFGRSSSSNRLGRNDDGRETR